jgi:hypothetical protein
VQIAPATGVAEWQQRYRALDESNMRIAQDTVDHEVTPDVT